MAPRWVCDYSHPLINQTPTIITIINITIIIITIITIIIITIIITIIIIITTTIIIIIRSRLAQAWRQAGASIRS